MRDIALLVFFSFLAPFCLASPYIGVLVMSWVGYMNPARLTWGFAYDLPFFQIAAILTFIAFFLTKEKKKFPLTPITGVFLCLLMWCGITTIFAQDVSKAFHFYFLFVKISFGLILTLYFFQDKDRIHKLIWVIVLSIGFFGFKGGIYTIVTAGSSGLVLGPPGTKFSGNTSLAVALLVAMPFMYYLFKMHKQVWVKVFMLALMGLSFVSAAGSHSRGAFLTMIAGAGVLWWRSKNKVLIACLILMGALVALPLMPEKYFTRMETIQTYEQDSSAMGRINAWYMAFNLASDRLTGGGYSCWSEANFMRYAPDPFDLHDAHSIYFEMLGEHGFPGLILFLTLFTLAWLKAGKIRRLTNKHEEYLWANMLSRMIQVSLVCYAVGGAFLGLAFFDLPYHIVMITVVMAQVVERQLKKESPARLQYST